MARTLPPPAHRRALLVAAGIVLAGPVPLALWSAVWEGAGPTMWAFRSAVVGDFLLLPLLGAALTLILLQLPAGAGERAVAMAGGLLGATAGVAVQVAWLVDPTPSLSWTLPQAHRFSGPGWWHAGFVIVGAATTMAALAVCAARARRARAGMAASRRSSRLAVAAIAFPGVSFTGLVALDGGTALGAAATATLLGTLLALCAAVMAAAVGVGMADAVAGAAAGTLAAVPLIALLWRWPPAPLVVALAATGGSGAVAAASAALTRSAARMRAMR